MDSLPIIFRVAQIVGIVGALWLSGNITSFSFISIPAFERSKSSNGVSSTTLAYVWKHSYDMGKSQNPFFAGVTAAAFSYLAFSSSLASRNFVLYLLAAVFTLAIIPFTLLCMGTTNDKLIRIAKVASEDSPLLESQKEKETMDIFLKWKNLNGFRGVLPLIGGVIGIIATFV